MKLPYLIAGVSAVLIAGATLASAQEVIVESPAVAPAYPDTYYRSYPAYPYSSYSSETYVYPGYDAYAAEPYVGERTVIEGRPITPDSGKPVLRDSETWRTRPGDSAS